MPGVTLKDQLPDLNASQSISSIQQLASTLSLFVSIHSVFFFPVFIIIMP